MSKQHHLAIYTTCVLSAYADAVQPQGLLERKK